MNKTNNSIWNITISTLTPDIFDDIEVHPVCTYADGDKIICEPCEPQDAEFWSVYVHYVGGGLNCIADCADQAIAKKLATLLKTIINNWQVKV